MSRMTYRTVRWIFGAIVLTLSVAIVSAVFPGIVPAAAALAFGASGIAGLIAALLLVRKAWLLREAELGRALTALTTTDPLTGLKNRVSFTQTADRILQRSTQSHRPAVLVVWNLGGVKGINEAEGAAAGDRALVAFARILESSARPTDIVGRIGGAQFAAILAGGTRHTGMLLAARVGQQAWNDWHGKGFTAACATAAYPDDGSTLEQLFAAATPGEEATFGPSSYEGLPVEMRAAS